MVYITTTATAATTSDYRCGWFQAEDAQTGEGCGGEGMFEGEDALSVNDNAPASHLGERGNDAVAHSGGALGETIAQREWTVCGGGRGAGLSAAGPRT